MYHLELPTDAKVQEQYFQAVVLIGISAIVELCQEPFFVLGQIFMWINFRVVSQMDIS